MDLIFSFLILFLGIIFFKNRALLLAISIVLVLTRVNSYLHLGLLAALILSGHLASYGIVKIPKHSKKILLSFNIISLLLFIFFKTQINDVDLINNLIRTKMPFGFSVLLFVINGYLIELYYDHKSKISWKTYYSELLFYPRLIIGPLYNLNKKSAAPGAETASLLGFFLISFGLLQFALSGLVGSLLGNGYSLSRDQLEFYHFNPVVLIILSTVFLYLNFSGFSYIILGLCKMTNRELVVNFRFPFGSQSMKIFWAHWHQSLGKWFQQYFYFPLQTQLIRKKIFYQNPKFLNFVCSFLVFLAIGAWHDISLKLFVWSAVNTFAVTFINFKNKAIGIITTNILIFLISGLFMSKSVGDFVFILNSIVSSKVFLFNKIIVIQLLILLVALTFVYFLEKFSLKYIDDEQVIESKSRLFFYTYFCLTISLVLGLSSISLTYDGF